MYNAHCIQSKLFRTIFITCDQNWKLDFLQWITVLAVWKVKSLASKQDFKCNYLLKKMLFIYL